VTADLAWGFRGSFLRYVESAGGTISLAPPAEWRNGRFEFPLVDRGDDEGGVWFGFGGEVALRAYGGMLDVQIADIQVRVEGVGGILSAALLDRSRRYSLARLSRRTAATTARVEFDTVLHEDAVAFFGGAYGPGAALDPVFLGEDDG
jgi:hypothetical protein